MTSMTFLGTPLLFHTHTQGAAGRRDEADPHRGPGDGYLDPLGHLELLMGVDFGRLVPLEDFPLIRPVGDRRRSQVVQESL